MTFGHNSFVPHTTGLKERIQKAEKETQMRPYRGFTKDGKWVKGWYCEIADTHFIIPNSAVRTIYKGINRSFVEVIPETVGQSTGLKDKNGTDLDWWQGDIFDDAGIIKVIIKDKGCFWFENAKSKRRIPCYEVAESSGYWAEEMKKIGSIHQNPELMEQTND